jgi:hypothetical protein
MTRLDATFAALVFIQAVHSVEKYVGRLWAVFPPAIAITGLVSQDRRLGFRHQCCTFDVWRLVFFLAGSAPLGSGRIAFWVMIEIINGIGHVVWTVRQHMYRYVQICTPPAL